MVSRPDTSSAKLAGHVENRVSGLDLVLDLDVDSHVRVRLSRHNNHQIAPYVCMPTPKSTSRSRSKWRTMRLRRFAIYAI